MQTILLLLLAGLLWTTAEARANSYELNSPDGRNQLRIATQPVVSYEVLRNGAPVLSPSALSMNVSGRVWGQSGKPLKATRQSADQTVTFPVARRYAATQERYNQLELHYKGYSIQFRAYDDAVAYRFVGRDKAQGDVLAEQVEYNFAHDYPTYTLLTENMQNWFEQDYTVKPFSALPADRLSVQPVMVDEPACKVVLTEANVYNYAGIYYKADGQGFRGEFAYYPKREEICEQGNKLYVTERENYIVRSSLDRSFPWRVAALFDCEADMLRSEIVYLLSDTTEEDFSWIKPGQVVWDWWNDNNIYNVGFRAGINTPTYEYFIDFAAANGVPYVLIDAGWSDLDDLLRQSPDMDMDRLCAYAAEKGVGLMLWTKWMTLDRQLDEAFEQFRRWDIKGVKIDYMDRNDAKMVDFYERVARKACQYRMLVDYHGSYPNEGMRRKYPVMMTREGVMGLEYNKWATSATPQHDVNIAYLRMLVGPMDYTPGAMSNAQGDAYRVSRTEPMSQGTRTHQLAMYVVYESPLQMLSDSPTNYLANRECFDFILSVPTTWDQSVPVAGTLSESVVVARRKGDIWYVGALGGNNACQAEIVLDFLGPGSYSMTAFEDGVNADRNGRDYRRSERTVTASEHLSVKMAPGGGFAAILRKTN